MTDPYLWTVNQHGSLLPQIQETMTRATQHCLGFIPPQQLGLLCAYGLDATMNSSSNALVEESLALKLFRISQLPQASRMTAILSQLRRDIAIPSRPLNRWYYRHKVGLILPVNAWNMQEHAEVVDKVVAGANQSAAEGKRVSLTFRAFHLLGDFIAQESGGVPVRAVSAALSTYIGCKRHQMGAFNAEVVSLARDISSSGSTVSARNYQRYRHEFFDEKSLEPAPVSPELPLYN